jgi:myo-inositol 2-dehydrogenase/D-chiro-inositol 1-dehydrogenase
MHNNQTTRRTFLQSAITTATIAGTGFHTAAATEDEKPQNPNSRLRVGAIGLRYQGSVITEKAQRYGDIVALCDVDQHVREQARAAFGSTPRIYENYVDMLAGANLDVVLIGVPDHWHVKMAADALRAGKDVYVEKPLSLTIDEGKFLRSVVNDTGKVLQVGSWQRSDSRFRLAIELIRAGRLGKLTHVDVVLGKNKVGGPFEQFKVPKHVSWNLW